MSLGGYLFMKDLKDFINRGRILQLFREALRISKRIKDESSRKETVLFIKNEFKGRQAKSPKHLEFLISGGKREIEQLRDTLSFY